MLCKTILHIHTCTWFVYNRMWISLAHSFYSPATYLKLTPREQSMFNVVVLVSKYHHHPQHQTWPGLGPATRGQGSFASMILVYPCHGPTRDTHVLLLRVCTSSMPGHFFCRRIFVSCPDVIVFVLAQFQYFPIRMLRLFMF